MTEKRSDYRKRQQKQSIFDKVKTAFSDEQENENIDVSSEFEKKDENQPDLSRRKLAGDGKPDLRDLNTEDIEKTPSEEKGLRLKKRLNRTILLLIVLIILVLLALFHL